MEKKITPIYPNKKKVSNNPVANEKGEYSIRRTDSCCFFWSDIKEEQNLKTHEDKQMVDNNLFLNMWKSTPAK